MYIIGYIMIYHLFTCYVINVREGENFLFFPMPYLRKNAHIQITFGRYWNDHHQNEREMNTHNTLCGVSGSRTRTPMMMIQSKMSCRKTICGQFESTQVAVTKLVFQFVNWLQQLGGLFFCSFCIFFKLNLHSSSSCSCSHPQIPVNSYGMIVRNLMAAQRCVKVSFDFFNFTNRRGRISSLRRSKKIRHYLF